MISRDCSRIVARLKKRSGRPGRLIKIGISTRSLLPVTSLKKDENDDRYRMVRQSGLLATIPFMLAVPPIAGLLIGRFIDNRIHTNPVFTIILMVFGFAAGIKEVAGIIKKANAEDKKNSQDKKQ